MVSTVRIWIEETGPDPGDFFRILAEGSNASWKPQATADVILVISGGREEEEEVEVEIGVGELGFWLMRLERMPCEEEPWMRAQEPSESPAEARKTAWWPEASEGTAALKLVMRIVGASDEGGMREWRVGSRLKLEASIQAARAPWGEQIRTETDLVLLPCDKMETKRGAFESSVCGNLSDRISADLPSE